jgi:hypothetical protein
MVELLVNNELERYNKKRDRDLILSNIQEFAWRDRDEAWKTQDT